jgi:hypothetical protein
MVVNVVIEPVVEEGTVQVDADIQALETLECEPGLITTNQDSTTRGSMIKRTPIIDINTGRVIKDFEKKKKAEQNIDLRKLPKEGIELEFDFYLCYFDEEGYFVAEGTGIVEAYIPALHKGIKVVTFDCKLDPERAAIQIYNIKKIHPNITGVRWLQKEWNENNEVEVLGRECEMLVQQGYWKTSSNMETKYVG